MKESETFHKDLRIKTTPRKLAKALMQGGAKRESDAYPSNVKNSKDRKFKMS